MIRKLSPFDILLAFIINTLLSDIKAMMNQPFKKPEFKINIHKVFTVWFWIVGACVFLLGGIKLLLTPIEFLSKDDFFSPFLFGFSFLWLGYLMLWKTNRLIAFIVVALVLPWTNKRPLSGNKN